MITLHEEERAGQTLPEYQERVIIESETASLASDLQPLPYDSATEDFVDGEQPPKTDGREEIQSISITPSGAQQATKGDGIMFRDLRPLESEDILSSNRKKMSVHLEPSKGYLQGEPMEGVDQIDHLPPAPEFLRKAMLQESSDADMVDATVSHSHCDEGDQNMRDLCDNGKFISNSLPQDIERQLDFEMDVASDNSKSLNYKRKHNTTPDGVTRQMLKSPKGDMTSDIDNSSDSGISGDLAEDVELHISSPNPSSPNPSSPLSKETCPESKGLTIEELVSNNLNSEDTENEYFVSLVHKVFGGKLATCIKCLQCKTESIHKDVFTDIHLAFQDTERYNATDAIRKNPSRLVRQETTEHSELSIEDMIKSYLTSERLTGENQYECERCGGKQDAERSIQILEPPEHLILTQLRFYYDTARGQRHKVFTNVEFGEELLLPIRYSTQGSFEEDLTSREQEIVISQESHGEASKSDTTELTGEQSSFSDSITSTQEKCISCGSSEACLVDSGSPDENCHHKTSLAKVSNITDGSSASTLDSEEASNSSKTCSSPKEKFGSSNSENCESAGIKSYLQANNSNPDPDSTSLPASLPSVKQSPISCTSGNSRNSQLASGTPDNMFYSVHDSSEPAEGKCYETLSNRSETLKNASCGSRVKVIDDSGSQSVSENSSTEPDVGNSGYSRQPSGSHTLGLNPETSYSFSHSEDFQADSNSSVHGESSSASSTNPQQTSLLDNSCRAITNLPQTTDCPMTSEYSECLSSKEECQDTQEVTYARYALYGVVVHSGFSSEGGHYYCYARNSSVAALPEAARERWVSACSSTTIGASVHVF